mmetsp:Transcript_74448/g.215824  ORF Transcript_74448/g.215824 Transcript_74448/m.215824 type:complete len:205 (-) Transcript_74448:4554-5168(-)
MRASTARCRSSSMRAATSGPLASSHVATASSPLAAAPRRQSSWTPASASAREISGTAAIISRTAAFSCTRRRMRQCRYSRESAHCNSSWMAPKPFMRPLRSWRSQYDTDTCRYIGSKSFSRSLTAWATSSPPAARESNWRRASSQRCIISSTCLSCLKTISAAAGGSKMPPRASTSANISICSGLIFGSKTTQAPPRNSPLGGM